MNTFSLARELEKSVGRTEPEIDTSEAFRAAREVLLQGLELLFELRDQTYSHASFITGMSIGQHYGQAIQHFRSLIRGCRAEEIRYEPDVRLQNDVAYASIAICDVLRAFKWYSPEMFDRQCYVSGRQVDGPNGKQTFASTLRLELTYCTANAIQQYAIIRGICKELGIDPLLGFGSAVNESWACPLDIE